MARLFLPSPPLPEAGPAIKKAAGKGMGRE